MAPLPTTTNTLPSDTDRRAALLALRTKAIEATNELIAVETEMVKLGFTGENVRRWLCWNILPSDLMQTAREPEARREEAGDRIDAACFGARCGRCGGECPPSSDGFCHKLGLPATRNYDG